MGNAFASAMRWLHMIGSCWSALDPAEYPITAPVISTCPGRLPRSLLKNNNLSLAMEDPRINIHVNAV